MIKRYILLLFIILLPRTSTFLIHTATYSLLDRKMSKLRRSNRIISSVQDGSPGDQAPTLKSLLNENRDLKAQLAAALLRKPKVSNFDQQEYEGGETMYCESDDECVVASPYEDSTRDRGKWLVGLLVLQSCSSFILAANEALLQRHPAIIYFLTMLVGAGGNAGNQASVRVIRGLALGTLTPKNQNAFLKKELGTSCTLAVLLAFAGFVRAMLFKVPLPETLAITLSLFSIVFFSIIFGASLPLVLKSFGVDPAHSSTSIQVIMDILGVVITVVVSTLFLDSPFGEMVVYRLMG
ncbi:hypothetical protein TrLO_g10938 [Triparma laevis f. longispina]|uniref:SLC41A/MgtE integral membrane domain-containing protein n=1 Tax=Triparma laevis f. longispina TaxID=1714387 RepID=A0A9W6ZUP9_9STRA|nr:hypothetical protein TrLO_g10938 [Triparma laevis f. longispina]